MTKKKPTNRPRKKSSMKPAAKGALGPAMLPLMLGAGASILGGAPVARLAASSIVPQSTLKLNRAKCGKPFRSNCAACV